jgi:hypothetical protein
MPKALGSGVLCSCRDQGAPDPVTRDEPQFCSMLQKHISCNKKKKTKKTNPQTITKNSHYLFVHWFEQQTRT